MGTDTLRVEVGSNGVRAGASVDEIIDIARYAATQNAAWNAVNCTGLVFAITNVAGVPLNPGTNVGNIVGNNPLTVLNGVGYSVSADSTDAWVRSSAIVGSGIDYSRIQAGDILRIQTSGGGGTTGVHSMIVTSVGGASPNQISVVDNWNGRVTEHSLSEVINYLNGTNTGSIGTFWIHRLDQVYVSNTVPATSLAGLGGGDFSKLPAQADIPGSSATTVELAVGSSVTSSIETIGDSDWFRVYLTAGQTYSFAVRGSETGNGTLNDPMIRLRSPSQTILLTDDDGGGVRDARITGFTATQSGYYFVTAYSADGGTGTYKISAVAANVTDNAGNSRATATAMSIGATKTGTVGGTVDTDDYFVFTASTTGTVTANLTGLSADLDLRAYNSAGAVLDTSTGSGSASERVDFNVVAGQTYYLHVDPYGSASSAYSLFLGIS